MSNLTKDRTPGANASYLNQPYFGPFDLDAGQVLYAGCMYAVDPATGFLRNPGSTSDVVAGVNMEHVSNTAGPPYYASGAAHDKRYRANLRSGVFAMDLHGTHPPTIADLFKPAYATDNHTISRLGSDGSYAGVIVLVEATLVYIYVHPFAAIRTSIPIVDNTTGVADVTDPATLAAITNPDLSGWNGATDPTAAQATAINAAITSLKNSVATLAALVASLR